MDTDWEMTDQRNWLFVTGPVARRIKCSWMLTLIAVKMLCRSFCLPRPEGCQYTRWTICPVLWHSIIVRVFTLIVRMIKTVRRYRMDSQLDMRSSAVIFRKRTTNFSLGQVNLRSGSCQVLRRCVRRKSDAIVNLRLICCSPLLFYR